MNISSVDNKDNNQKITNYKTLGTGVPITIIMVTMTITRAAEVITRRYNS